MPENQTRPTGLIPKGNITKKCSNCGKPTFLKYEQDYKGKIYIKKTDGLCEDCKKKEN